MDFTGRVWLGCRKYLALRLSQEHNKPDDELGVPPVFERKLRHFFFFLEI